MQQMLKFLFSDYACHAQVYICICTSTVMAGGLPVISYLTWSFCGLARRDGDGGVAASFILSVGL